MDKHYHWQFIAYDEMKKVGERDEYVQAVTVTVIGFDNEENALIGVKDVVTRNRYVLNYVYECNTCKFQSQMNTAIKDMTNKM